MSKLLVCDLDNTLYDWVGYFVSAFYAFVDKVVDLTGCDRDKLLDDFRDVHRKHHDAEHPFAVLETDTIKRHFQGKSSEEIADALDPAFHVFNSHRKRSLVLYPGVRETLDTLRDQNVKLVAHTESKLFAVVDRLSRLDLTKYFSHIYCRERPKTLQPKSGRSERFLADFPMELVIELSHHQRKPNSDVLFEICNREGVLPDSTAYIGDSMARDVLMAKRSGVFAIWAKYGVRHSDGDYEKLVRVSHWTDEDVAREKLLVAEVAMMEPDFVAEHSFAQVLNALAE